jgi:hypothetical protein
MTTVLEEFVGKLGWQIDQNGPKEFKNQAASVGKAFAKIGAAYSAVAGLVTGFVTRVNNQTAANYRLAKSIGVSYDWLDKWGDATESAGIGAQGVSAAVAYLQKQLGHAALGQGAQGVQGAVNALGLSFSDLRGMDSGAQLKAIVAGLSAIEDQSKVTAVSSQLLGRSGGVAFANLTRRVRESGMTFDQYLDRFDAYEFETAESAESAFKFAESAEMIGVAFTNIKVVLAAYIGEALLPMLEGAKEWIRNNRELITSKLVDWAKATASWLKSVWDLVSKIGGALGPLIQGFGGLGNVLKYGALGYVAVKFAQATKGVGNLSAGLTTLTGAAMKQKMAGFFTGPAGVAGLAAVAMASIIDLADSLDDISNNSFGNIISRKILKTKEQIHIWVAETFFGKQFRNDADRANYIAQLDKAQIVAFERLKARMSAMLDWIMNTANPFKAIVNFGKNWRESGGAANAANAIAGALGSDSRVSVPNSGGYGGKKIEAPPNTSGNYFGGVSVQAPMTINAAPGMSANEVATAVNKQLEKTVSRAVKNARSQNAER